MDRVHKKPHSGGEKTQPGWGDGISIQNIIGRSSGLPARCSPSHPIKPGSDFKSRRKIFGTAWNVAPGQCFGHCQDHSIGHYAAASHRLPFSPSTTTIMVFGTESSRIRFLD